MAEFSTVGDDMLESMEAMFELYDTRHEQDDDMDGDSAEDDFTATDTHVERVADDEDMPAVIVNNVVCKSNVNCRLNLDHLVKCMPNPQYEPR